ncbi:MAG: hypothetical protein ABI836_06815 [Gemmatimonadota bacterium]
MAEAHATRSSRRILTGLFLVTCFAGCTSWHTETGAPAEMVAAHPGSQIRVTLADGQRQYVRQPRIENDTLRGLVQNNAGAIQPRAIPLDSVKSIAISRFNAGKTVLVAVGLGATIAVIAALPGKSKPKPVPTGGGEIVSCPLVYSWDGTQWHLDSGTFGGAIMPALARTDVDNLEYATAADGKVRLRIANELNETDHVDAISLIAVDHDPDVTIAPASDGTLHTLGTLVQPSVATDDRGINVLPQVLRVDGWNWESALRQRDTSRLADTRDGIELTFPRPHLANHAKLVVDGNNTPWAASMMVALIGAHGREAQAWYDSLAASPALARATGTRLASEAFLDVELKRDGRWVHQDFIWEAGPEISKRQVLVVDLTGISGDSVQLRLESAPMLWLLDQVAIDYSEERTMVVHELQADRAVTGDGVDIRPLLRSIDHSSYDLETGDGADLSFMVPPVPAGQIRSYLLKSTGWYRVHAPDTGERDQALLARVFHEPLGVSRAVVARFNDALSAFNQSSQDDDLSPSQLRSRP